MRVARKLLERLVMSFTVSLNRVQLDFVAMPELELTLSQAVRFWALGADDCRVVLDTLVDAGFLRWTPSRTVVRNRRVSRGSRVNAA